MQRPPVYRCNCCLNQRPADAQWRKCACCDRVQHAGCQGPHAACIMCRCLLSDPFWWGTTILVCKPIDLEFSGTFVLTHAQHALVSGAGRSSRVQLSLLESRASAMSYASTWPTGARLEVDGAEVDVPSGQTAPLDISTRCVPGGSQLTVRFTEKLAVPAFLVCVLAKKRTKEDVVARLLCPALSLSEAEEHVRDSFGTADGDDVRQEACRVSLRCPLTMARVVRTPARIVRLKGKGKGKGAMDRLFDLDVFLDKAEEMCWWRCPYTSKEACVMDVQVDTYMQAILHALRDQPAVMDVQIGPDARWRPVGPNGRVNPSQPWHRAGVDSAAPLEPVPGGADVIVIEGDDDNHDAKRPRLTDGTPHPVPVPVPVPAEPLRVRLYYSQPASLAGKPHPLLLCECEITANDDAARQFVRTHIPHAMVLCGEMQSAHSTVNQRVMCASLRVTSVPSPVSGFMVMASAAMCAGLMMKCNLAAGCRFLLTPMLPATGVVVPCMLISA